MAHTPNTYRIEGDIAVLELLNGFETKIDKSDLHKALELRWSAVKNQVGGHYAIGSYKDESGKRTTTYLHRWLTDAPKGKVVDHLNHDTLDNRRSCNLRVVSNRDNTFNRKGPGRYNKSGHRGVSVHTTKEGYKMWVARITVAKYFPYTEEGLEQSVAKADELRTLLHQIDPDES